MVPELLVHLRSSESGQVALENTVSVASVLLLAEATLIEIPEPKRDSIGATASEPAY